MNPGAWWRYSAAAMPLLAVSALAQPAWSACAPNQPGCQQEHQAPPPQHQQAPPPQHFEAPRPQPQQFQPQQHFEAPRPQPQQFQPQQHFEAPHPPPAAPHPQPQQFQQQPAPHPQQFQPQQHFEAHPQPAPHPQPQQFQQHAPPPGGFHPAPGGQAAQFQHDQFQHGVPPQRDLHAGHYSYRGHDYDRFRAEPYRWSRGEHYERYRIGARLPLAFIISSFIIADWAAYGLAPPPYGYEWVRYGPDVLLVDPGTGLIQDGAYSMFADTSDAGPPVYAAPPAYAPPPVTGQPQPLGRFGAWSAAMYQEGGQTVCYTFSPAFGSSQSLPGRPAPVLSVTQRPGLRDTVSISEGLNLPSGAPVSAQLDGASLDFFADGPTAYARNGAVAVAAFQRGNRADVTVPAPGGGPLTDSFNLSGFSAAYATISQACPQ